MQLGIDLSAVELDVVSFLLPFLFTPPLFFGFERTTLPIRCHPALVHFWGESDWIELLLLLTHGLLSVSSLSATVVVVVFQASREALAN